MTWSRPISTWLAPALILALGVSVILLDAFGLQSALSNRLFDAYQRHAARAPSPSPVRVLDLPSLDEDSLTALTRSLAGQGARLVIFTAPLESGPSPQSLSSKLPPGDDAGRAALAKLPEPGHDLAQALAALPNVVPVMLGSAGRMPSIKARFLWRGTRAPFGAAPLFNAAAAPMPLIETNATGEAAPNLLADNDGVVRRLPLVFRLGNGLAPGMAAEAARLLDKEDAITFVSNERSAFSFLQGAGIAGLARTGLLMRTDRDGRIRLHYAAGGGTPALNPDAPGALKGAIVVIGAQGALVRTPFGSASIASVTAQGLENLLAGDVLVRPIWAPVFEALFLVFAGLGMLIVLRRGAGWAAAWALICAAGLMLVSWRLYAGHRMEIDAVTPCLALALSFAVAVLAYVQEMRLSHAGLRMAFSDFLSRDAIEKITRRPQLLKLEGQQRSITYLVCGVRDPQRLAAAHGDDAAAFARQMQQLLTPLIDAALAHGGTIDRLTADSFAAFWNAPLDDPEHALHACEAASDMAAIAARLNEETLRDWRGDNRAPPIEIGVGIATGPAIAGGFGGAGRIGYSVQGNVVALAARLQAASHQYGFGMIAAQDTRQQAERGFAFLEIDAVADQNVPVRLYAIMGNSVSRASPKFRALTVFHDHIFQAMRKQQWHVARELIAQCRRLSGASQQLYDLHLARIAWYEQHPPGSEWDGAFRPVLV